MYSNDLRDKFIELRAQNISIRNIAEQLGVHRNTLLDWELKYREEIDNLRAIELEAIQERLLPKYEQEVTELAEEYKRVTAELRTRDCDYEPTAYLANRQLSLLSRMEKMRKQARFTPPKPKPESGSTT